MRLLSEGFGMTEVILLITGFSVIVAVFVRRFGFKQGWKERDKDDDLHN